MDLKEKVRKILDDNGLKSERQLAAELGLNYAVFNRNINDNRLTADMIFAFANNNLIKSDLNWLARSQENTLTAEEPRSHYSVIPVEELDQAIAILNNLKEKVSRS